MVTAVPYYISWQPTDLFPTKYTMLFQILNKWLFIGPLLFCALWFGVDNSKSCSLDNYNSKSCSLDNYNSKSCSLDNYNSKSCSLDNYNSKSCSPTTILAGNKSCSGLSTDNSKVVRLDLELLFAYIHIFAYIRRRQHSSFTRTEEQTEIRRQHLPSRKSKELE